MLPRMTETSILAGLPGLVNGTTARSGGSSLAWATAQAHVPAARSARTAIFASFFMILFIFSSLSLSGRRFRSLGDQDVAGQGLELDLRSALARADAIAAAAPVNVRAVVLPLPFP